VPQLVAYRNPNPRTKSQFPLLLDIQSDLLDDLTTTVVIPLSPETLLKGAAMTKLNPVIEIEDVRYVAVTQQLAGIERRLLGEAIEEDLSCFRGEVIAALDFLISGI